MRRSAKVLLSAGGVLVLTAAGLAWLVATPSGQLPQKPTSHVEAVADLWLLVHIHILHDVADLLGAFECDGQSPVHLSVIPIHFGETQDLLA